jgi:DNA-binding response OmpR family regulator
MTASGTLAKRPLLLVVDDAPDVVLVVQHLGRRAGYEVESCADVPSAWAAVRRRTPDLVLLDVNLPGESGLVLCRRVRETRNLAKVPIAVFGLAERPSDLVGGLGAGADFVISKDLLCRPAEWASRIQETLTPLQEQPFQGGVPTKHVSGSAAAWALLLNRSLHSLVLPCWGAELTEAMVRRATRRAGANALVASLLSMSGASEPRVQGTPAQWAALAVALAHELWCIGGAGASAPFWDTLTAAFPILAERFANA